MVGLSYKTRRKMISMKGSLRQLDGSPICPSLHNHFIKEICYHHTSTEYLRTTSSSKRCYFEQLSMWNQYAPRVYIGLVLCFPFDNAGNNRLRAERHIRESLNRLAEARPDFAARLRVDTEGCASLQRCPTFKIPLGVSSRDERHADKLAPDYESQKSAGFPPSMFIHKDLVSPGVATEANGGVPVSQVRLKFVDGGLYLMLQLHHALFDGCSMGIFLDCFAAQQTRSEKIIHLEYPKEQLFIPARNSQRIITSDQSRSRLDRVRHRMFEYFASQCPEYAILPDKSGPTQPKVEHSAVPMAKIKRSGKIFVFRNDRLQALREMVRRELNAEKLPTSYTVLAALTWAHVVQARHRHESYMPGERRMNSQGEADSEADETDSNNKQSSLWNSVSWRPRANKEEATEYFGNAVLPVVTRLPLQTVLEACSSINHLATQLVPQVQETISTVDQIYVDKREAMMRMAPDPRLVGVNYDPRMREMVHFNTWRHFGANTEWMIPGVPVQRTEAIRRVHGEWNLGTALILPAPADAETQELFVSLSVDAMEALCRDQEWMEWVDRVIG
ncbi:uncharacterized protein B0I36DRAFT_325377 [Microdochium trichocladiopsis]|uniref:Uncharacterized protein n=1 Tax=Microdochium trichocladiopsis TaxID=1682393 RepID=A0A9P8Y4L2_9PEZI|nr:uncharacterized protein B0I36DRAFT_325377 [Microdochium trichocladiopsis]KAH7029269.1 hypothetical protein B0I36DRAFT_325377 [Microdochium trichocladiopsis]